jgi:peptidoglycan/xylan/chitin deacetylase (PgdA/CDA1 family)
MADRRLILTFHGLGDPPADAAARHRPLWIPERSFEEILDAIEGRRDVEISFDDGRRSDAEIALPALRSRDLSASFFILMGSVGTPGYLTAEEIRELAAEGMTIGSHGMRHRSWRELSDEELKDDLVASKVQLEAILGRPVDRAACPLGDYDRRVLRRARAAGYRRVYTSDEGWARSAAWLQPRNTLYADRVAPALPRLAAGRLPYRRRPLRGLRLLSKRWR